MKKSVIGGVAAVLVIVLTASLIASVQALRRHNDCSIHKRKRADSQEAARRKRVENTMKYIGMINFKTNEYEVTTATDVEEAKKVLAAGFEYVIEKQGIMLSRKPKRFTTVNS